MTNYLIYMKAWDKQFLWVELFFHHLHSSLGFQRLIVKSGASNFEAPLQNQWISLDVPCAKMPESIIFVTVMWSF